MTAAADIAEARADAWRASRSHRPARLALEGRNSIDAKIVGDEDFAEGGGRGAGRHQRVVTASFVAADIGGQQVTPNTVATVTDETSGETITGKVSGVARSATVWSLTVSS